MPVPPIPPQALSAASFLPPGASTPEVPQDVTWGGVKQEIGELWDKAGEYSPGYNLSKGVFSLVGGVQAPDAGEWELQPPMPPMDTPAHEPEAYVESYPAREDENTTYSTPAADPLPQLGGFGEGRPETTYQDTMMHARPAWTNKSLSEVDPKEVQQAAESAERRAETIESKMHEWALMDELSLMEEFNLWEEGNPFDRNIENMERAYVQLQSDLEDLQTATDDLQSGDTPDYVTVRQERSPHAVVRVNNYVDQAHISYFHTGVLTPSGKDTEHSLLDSYEEKLLLVPTEEPFAIRRSWLSNPGERLPPMKKHFRGGYSNAIGFYQTTVRNFDALGVPSSHIESIQSDVYPLAKSKSRLEQKKWKELQRGGGAEFPLLKDDQWIEHILQRHVADAINTNKQVISMNSGKAAQDVNIGIPTEVAKGIYDKKAKRYLQDLAEQYKGSFYTIHAPTKASQSETRDVYVLDLRGGDIDSLKREGFGYANGGLVTNDLSAADFLPKGQLI